MPANRRVSSRQLEMLIAFCEKNLDLALGRCARGAQAHQTATRAWNTLAARLNAVADGMTKNGDQWRRYWIELKAKTKAKGADIRRNATKTGGGPNKLVPLTSIEERVLQIVGRVAVEGLPGVQIPFHVSNSPSHPSPITPQPGPSSQTHSQPSPSVAKDTVSLSTVPEPYMEVEWLDDQVLSDPPKPTQALLASETLPPPAEPPAVLPLSQSIATMSPDIQQPEPPRCRRHRSSTLRDLPRWARETEERRLAFEEQMVGLVGRMVDIMEHIEQRLANINQNLSDLSTNLRQ